MTTGHGPRPITPTLRHAGGNAGGGSEIRTDSLSDRVQSHAYSSAAGERNGLADPGANIGFVPAGTFRNHQAHPQHLRGRGTGGGFSMFHFGTYCRRWENLAAMPSPSIHPR